MPLPPGYSHFTVAMSLNIAPSSPGKAHPKEASPCFGQVPFSPEIKGRKMVPTYVTNRPPKPADMEEALREHGQDGFTLPELLRETPGLTYDDFLMLPGHIFFAPQDVSTSTRLTRNIRIKCPFVSSPMVTVSEANLAVAMALQGGIGILHYNCSIEEQAEMVRSVKRYKNGFITHPLTMGP